MSRAGLVLLPNLGAEEGDDWSAYRSTAHTRIAARLWSHLFAGDSELWSPRCAHPKTEDDFSTRRCESLWPAALGPVPSEPSHPWLAAPDAALPWLATRGVEETIERLAGRRRIGPDPASVARVHDKAFALREACDAGMLPPALTSALTVLDPDDLSPTSSARSRIAEVLASWPEPLRARFALKPRFGTSGRGRVAGRDALVDASDAVLARLAARGGAILEPWLERGCDLSACVHVPPPGETDALPTLLGSLELLVTPGGVFRGHCGEVDARGRIYSGHAADEDVRAGAAWLAGRAKGQGFFGPCGIDAFTYRDDDGSERLRPAVELNARSTMGLVTLGIVRRALPIVRERLGLVPENRRAFLVSLLPRAKTDAIMREIADRTGPTTLVHRLDRPEAARSGSDDPVPVLVFSRERRALREAYREIVGC